jgi:transposase
VLREWQEHDAHLWQWERHNFNRALRARQYFYRNLAAQLRQRYRRIVVEDCDWRKLMRLPNAESNESVNATARYWQRVAAVGMLRDALKQAGAVMTKTENTTRECHLCGHVNQWKDQTPLVLMCGGCGESWDQDDNAARILLARAKAADLGSGGHNPCAQGLDRATGNDGDAATVANGGGRWQRRKVARSQKESGSMNGDGLTATAGTIPVHEG